MKKYPLLNCVLKQNNTILQSAGNSNYLIN
jgi:hypothetical protein